ncbi:uncharacterized protein LOC6583774 [Drosophila mojavensis]|uniref:Uncharacterized protein n=1 Tax=Drosophila mojavensis TaxID=7230 RepID=B4L1V3_DROMO|nr:uncharacterized protein LOC6583774 [Drosophila mojavensis]EDW06756.1 uncharacterized protein Dmoj_GI15350 [Drosophila mojavensis]
MCMPYLGKLFGGDRRRRNHGSESLAPTPQQSSATIQTSAVTNIGTGNKESVSRVKPVANTAAQRSRSAVALKREASKAAAANASVSQAAPDSAAAPAAAGSAPKPTSWWEYFGMNRNKKGSIDSL